MNIETLLGEIPKTKFVQEYFHRLPFSLAGAARSVCQLGSWKMLGEILGQDGMDVMVVRDGHQDAGSDPTTVGAVKTLSSKGYTILVRHVKKHNEELEALATAFKDDFHAPVNIHIYATPAGKHGFSWHYDAEEVFIMQTSGQKEYSLRKNTVNSWPLIKTIPNNMGYEREVMPLVRGLLSVGDWLYIPCGYWHKAEARDSDETAISLALDVMSPSAIDVYDYLRARLLNSLLWGSDCLSTARSRRFRATNLYHAIASCLSNWPTIWPRRCATNDSCATFLREGEQNHEPTSA